MALDLDSGEEILLRFNIGLNPKSQETLYKDSYDAWLTNKHLIIDTQPSREKIVIEKIREINLSSWNDKKIIQIQTEKPISVLVVGPPRKKKRTIIDPDTKRLFRWLQKIKTLNDVEPVLKEIKEIQTYFGSESSARNDREYMIDMVKKTATYVFLFTIVMLVSKSLSSKSLLSSAIFGSIAAVTTYYIIKQKK